MSAIFHQIFIFSSSDRPSETMKNVFYLNVILASLLGLRVVFLVNGTIFQQRISVLKNCASAGKRNIIFTVDKLCQRLWNQRACDC